MIRVEVRLCVSLGVRYFHDRVCECGVPGDFSFPVERPSGCRTRTQQQSRRQVSQQHSLFQTMKLRSTTILSLLP